jgi:hypothetical protein
LEVFNSREVLSWVPQPFLSPSSRLIESVKKIWSVIKDLSPSLFGALGFEVKATIKSSGSQVVSVRDSLKNERLAAGPQQQEQKPDNVPLVAIRANTESGSEYMVVTNKKIDAKTIDSTIDASLKNADYNKVSVAEAGKAIGPNAVKNFTDTLAKQGIKYDALVGAVDNKTGVVFLFAIDAKKGVVAYTNQGITGEQEITTTSFLVKNGKVTQMSGKVFRGDQVINYKQIFGAGQVQAAMAEIKSAEFTKGSEADVAFSAVMANAQQMREETLEDGTLLTRTYLSLGSNGELRVSASENAIFDNGNVTGYVLRVYDENGGGMVFARKTTDKYAAQTGTFLMANLKITEAISALKSNVQTASLGQLISALSQSGAIQGNVLMYSEKDMKGNMVKGVVMDEASGILKAVVDYDDKGGVAVTVMKSSDLASAKKAFDGQSNVTFKSFDTMKGKEQTELVASLPALGRRNAAILADRARAFHESYMQQAAATIMKELLGGIEAKDRNFPMPKGVADSLGLHPKSYMRVTDILTTKDDKQLLKVQFITIGKSGEEVVGQGWVIPGLAMGEDANHTIIAKDGRDGPQGTTVGPDLETVSGKIGVMLDAKKLSSVLAGATSLRDTLELGAPSLWDFSLSDAAIQVQSIVRISLDLFVPGTILNAVLGSLGNLSDHDRELNLTKESLVEGLGRVGEAMDAIKNDMGQLTTQALQLENHGKIMNQLFKTAGLDGEVTRSAVEAFTQISGLKNISARMMSLENDVLEWGFEMDSIQTMGDAKKAAQSLNAIKKELSSLKEMISTGTRVLDKRIQLTFEVEKSLVEMIKNPEKSDRGQQKTYRPVSDSSGRESSSRTHLSEVQNRAHFGDGKPGRTVSGTNGTGTVGGGHGYTFSHAR